MSEQSVKLSKDRSHVLISTIHQTLEYPVSGYGKGATLSWKRLENDDSMIQFTIQQRSRATAVWVARLTEEKITVYPRTSNLAFQMNDIWTTGSMVLNGGSGHKLVIRYELSVWNDVFAPRLTFNHQGKDVASCECLFVSEKPQIVHVVRCRKEGTSWYGDIMAGTKVLRSFFITNQGDVLFSLPETSYWIQDLDAQVQWAYQAGTVQQHGSVQDKTAIYFQNKDSKALHERENQMIKVWTTDYQHVTAISPPITCDVWNGDLPKLVNGTYRYPGHKVKFLPAGKIQVIQSLGTVGNLSTNNQTAKSDHVNKSNISKVTTVSLNQLKAQAQAQAGVPENQASPAGQQDPKKEHDQLEPVVNSGSPTMWAIPITLLNFFVWVRYNGQDAEKEKPYIGLWTLLFTDLWAFRGIFFNVSPMEAIFIMVMGILSIIMVSI